MKIKRAILKETKNFVLYTSGRQHRLRYKKKDATPRGRQISQRDADYLLGCGRSFDAACVLEMGVAVFQRK